MSKEEFPKTLNHPHFRKGTITEIKGKDAVSGKPFTDYQGEPDLFPPVTVNNDNQEAFYRAKGYLPPGEAPPPPADYAEYPVMLSHPDHAEAIQDEFDVRKGPSGEAISTRIPGRPEKFPPVMVKSAEEERVWEVRGYKRTGTADAIASQRAKASPYDPEYKKQEYPKFVDGKIVDPHATMSHNRYPMYIGDVLVNNAREEAAIRGEEPSAPAEKCLICGEDISEDDPVAEGALGKYHLAHMAGGAVVTQAATQGGDKPAPKKRGPKPKPKPESAQT